jgi:predicted AAA+ superfamily ATPase
MEKLKKKSNRIIEQTKLDFQRSLITELPWNERLVGIKGSRGVGKTTLLLQYIKQEYGISSQAMYISLDELYFTGNTLVDFAEEFISLGGKHLFIDEVHKYPNWSVELKNIYDTFPELKVVFTGSSLLEILNSRSDLSRRALVYSLNGLSFREYLLLSEKIELPQLSLNETLKNHEKLAFEISKTVKPLAYFDQYLRIGYFPFYQGDETLYQKRIQEILNMIIEIELPTLRKTDYSIVSKIKQLLYIISQSVPFKPNVTKLSAKINTTRKTILEYINYLTDANVFNSLYKSTHGIGLLQKPEKLFLENTNFMFAVQNQEPNKGSLRETFFYNQLAQNHQLTYPEKGDFLVDEKFTFEIGGRNKTGQQLKGVENAFVAADGIDVGVGNKIPLWMFGLLY